MILPWEMPQLDIPDLGRNIFYNFVSFQSVQSFQYKRFIQTAYFLQPGSVRLKWNGSKLIWIPNSVLNTYIKFIYWCCYKDKLATVESALNTIKSGEDHKGWDCIRCSVLNQRSCLFLYFYICQLFFCHTFRIGLSNTS